MSDLRQSSCKEVGGLLAFYACGETSEQENAVIEAHLAECAECAAQLAEERGLHESLMDALQTYGQDDPGGILLAQCRSELAEALDDLSAPPLYERLRPVGWLRRWIVMRPILSGSMLLLFGAAVGAQLLPWISAQLEPASNGQMVSVSPTTKFTDEQLSKMAVAGINLAPAPSGTPGMVQVQVRTEEPVVLSGSVDDPDLRRVLTYVVENGEQTDAGVRLDCLEALRARASDADVRRALLFAARRDQNPAVRMKALESLRDSVSDQAVRDTLVDALQHDSNPGVRVEAVNLLVRSLEESSQQLAVNPEPTLAPDAPGGMEHPLDPAMEHVVRALQELQRSDPNRYVRLRSAAALRQIGPRDFQ